MVLHLQVFYFWNKSVAQGTHTIESNQSATNHIWRVFWVLQRCWKALLGGFFWVGEGVYVEEVHF